MLFKCYITNLSINLLPFMGYLPLAGKCSALVSLKCLTLERQPVYYQRGLWKVSRGPMCPITSILPDATCSAYNMVLGN